MNFLLKPEVTSAEDVMLIENAHNLSERIHYHKLCNSYVITKEQQQCGIITAFYCVALLQPFIVLHYNSLLLCGIITAFYCVAL